MSIQRVRPPIFYMHVHMKRNTENDVSYQKEIVRPRGVEYLFFQDQSCILYFTTVLRDLQRIRSGDKYTSHWVEFLESDVINCEETTMSKLYDSITRSLPRIYEVI